MTDIECFEIFQKECRQVLETLRIKMGITPESCAKACANKKKNVTMEELKQAIEDDKQFNAILNEFPRVKAIIGGM